MKRVIVNLFILLFASSDIFSQTIFEKGAAVYRDNPVLGIIEPPLVLIGHAGVYDKWNKSGDPQSNFNQIMMDMNPLFNWEERSVGSFKLLPYPSFWGARRTLGTRE